LTLELKGSSVVKWELKESSTEKGKIKDQLAC
jgi:hypothetical protein